MSKFGNYGQTCLHPSIWTSQTLSNQIVFWRPKKKKALYLQLCQGFSSFFPPLYEHCRTSLWQFNAEARIFFFISWQNSISLVHVPPWWHFDYVNQAGDIRLKLYCSSQIKTKMMVKKKNWNFHFGILPNWNPNTIKDKHDVLATFQLLLLL